MGYYVTLESSDVVIPGDKEYAAFDAVCELNARNDLKSGGRFGAPKEKPADSQSLGNPDQWFSWMDWNYDETCSNLKEVLEALGFGVITDPYSGDISFDFYDNKRGSELEFFKALAPFIPDGSFMEWIGEDGMKFKWKFDGESLIEA